MDVKGVDVDVKGLGWTLLGLRCAYITAAAAAATRMRGAASDTLPFGLRRLSSP